MRNTLVIFYYIQLFCGLDIPVVHLQIMCLIQCVSSVAVLSTVAVSVPADAFLLANGFTEHVWCVSECVV